MLKSIHRGDSDHFIIVASSTDLYRSGLLRPLKNFSATAHPHPVKIKIRKPAFRRPSAKTFQPSLPGHEISFFGPDFVLLVVSHNLYGAELAVGFKVCGFIEN